MNIADAKAIPLDELLQRLGFQPAKQQGGRLWYRSPFRDEKTASFVLSKDGFAWFDHGEGKGGNIIDLAMRLGDCRDVPQALSWLTDATGHMAMTIPTIRQRLPVTPDAPAYTVQAVRTLADHRGENWCRSRGLDVDACRPYLSDIYFNRTQKPLAKPMYGVGLPNIAEGFEMRTQLQGGPWIKSSIGHKTITVFQSERENAPWYAFEGLPDFCTFLTLRRPPVGHVNLLILNGTGMTGAAIEYLSEQPASCLYLCPQHGSQGSLTSCEALRDFAAGAGWDGGDIDYPADLYDYNAWHMKQKGLQPTSAPAVRNPVIRHTPKI